MALAVGILPCLPGFLTTVGWVRFAAVWTELYHYAWFLSFAIAFAVYLGLMKVTPGDSLAATRS